MKNISWFCLVVLICMLLFACSDSTSPDNEGSGSIPIGFSLSPLAELDVDVTSGIVTLTKENDEIERSMLIANNNASVTVDNLDPGIWHLLVQLYSNEYVVAEGNTDVEVIPGQTSEVNLTLVINDVTGSVTINVDWEVVEPTPSRILFIGNSYTYYNNGLNNLFEEYSISANPDLDITTMAITGGGMTLENHFNNQATINEIQSGNWDYVVLQEQSQMPILNTEHFLTYATKLDSVIDLSGAQTCFFMTWAREYDQSQIEGLSSAYLQAGRELDAIVVPVGQVFNYIFEDDNNNDIVLYSGDGSHPSAAGSYTAAACFYRKFYNAPATSATATIPNVSFDEAEYIRNAVEDWFIHN
jgi:hypothetical protein